MTATGKEAVRQPSASREEAPRGATPGGENHQRRLPDVFFMDFRPEEWTALDRFHRFVGAGTKLSSHGYSSLNAVAAHWRKFDVLKPLLVRMSTGLIDDLAEFDLNGWSRQRGSKEFAAVLETTLCELYSVIDCARQVLREVYGHLRGFPKESTSRLFKNAVEGKLDERVPAGLREELAAGHHGWFDELRRLRRTVVHSNVGYCRHHQDVQNEISYFNYAIHRDTPAISEVFATLGRLGGHTERFLDIAFGDLVDQLPNVEVKTMCGIWKGRIYMRRVRVQEATDSHAGVCISRQWFDAEEGAGCPLAATCGAYRA